MLVIVLDLGLSKQNYSFKFLTTYLDNVSPFLALPFVLKLLELPLRVCSGRDFVSAEGVTRGVATTGGSTLVTSGAGTLLATSGTIVPVDACGGTLVATGGWATPIIGR